MVLSIIHITWLSILLSPWTFAEMFTAIARMEPLLKTQKRILDDLDDYILQEDIRLAVLKSYLENFKEEHVIANENVSKYLGNPLNAFSLIKRLTTDLTKVGEYIKLGKENTKSVTLSYFDVKYPTRDDLIGAAQAIIRLQNTYRLDVHDLAEGRIYGVKQGNPMTAAECFELSRTVYSQGDYNNTIVWSMQALRKYREETPAMLSFDETDILELISFSHYLIGDLTTALEWAKKLLQLDPDHSRARRNVPIWEEAIANKQANQSEGEGGQNTENIEVKIPTPKEEYLGKLTKTYEALCRGEGEISSKVANRLHCYMAGKHPFQRLAPFKVEQLYIQPDVLLFHDVISDGEIEIIKNRATPLLQRSSAGNSEEEVDYRISESAWLHDLMSHEAARVSQRVADMTGLSIMSAELLHVANYGIGGHYMPHLDCTTQETLKSIPSEELTGIHALCDNNNRIATVLFYMSDVEQGGATVFTELGLSVAPEKGAALFWHNLHLSGEADFDTVHGACPVLRGSKWVCTKWLRQVGQELLRPCNLEYQEEDMRLREAPEVTSTS